MDRQLTQSAQAAALRTVKNIFAEWDISDSEAAKILGLELRKYGEYCDNPEAAPLDAQLLQRLSYVLGIFKALRMLYKDRAIGKGWVRRGNFSPAFNGKSPLEVILERGVSGLRTTRRYLEARVS